MPRRPRRNHTAAFKAKVALAAVKGEKDAIGIGAGVRCSSESDNPVEGPAVGGSS